MTKLHMIPRLEALRRWDKDFQPMIRKALDKNGAGELDVVDIYNNILAGTEVIWEVVDDQWNTVVVLTTVVIRYAEFKRWMQIAQFASKPHTTTVWLKHLPELEQYAKELEVKGIEIIGRKGWEKLMEPYGFKFRAIKLTKELA